MLILATAASSFFLAASSAPEEYKLQPTVLEGNAWRHFQSELRADGQVLDSMNQYFTLSAILRSSRSDEEAVGAAIRFVVRTWGRDGAAEEWAKVTDTEHEHELSCPKGRAECDPITLVRECSLAFQQYRVEVSAVSDLEDGYGFVESATYEFAYVAAYFTFYEIAVKSVCLALTVWRGAVFVSTLMSHLGTRWIMSNPRLQIEHRLVLLSFAALLCLIDPAFLVACVTGGWASRLISVILSATAWILLFGVLLVWLPFAHRVRRLGSARGLGCATLSLGVGVLWAATVVAAVYMCAALYRDPAYNVLEASPYAWAWFSGVILGISGLLLGGALVSACRRIGRLNAQIPQREEDRVWAKDRRRRASFVLAASASLVVALAAAASPLWLGGQSLLVGGREHVLTYEKTAEYVTCGTASTAAFVFALAWAFAPVLPTDDDEEVVSFLARSGTGSNAARFF
jgi:hypothetical protein